MNVDDTDVEAEGLARHVGNKASVIGKVEYGREKVKDSGPSARGK